MNEPDPKKLRPRIIERIATWYRGRYIPPPKFDPTAPLIIISTGHYQRPMIARILDAVGRFIASEWKWLIGIAVALLAIVLNFFLNR